MSTETRPPSLAETQRWLSWIITEPAGVAPALSSVSSHHEPEPKPRQLASVAARAPLTRTERLSVYAEAYFSRLLEALEIDYPLLREALGEEAFGRLIAEYLEVHPSRSADLNALGSALPDFVAGWDELEDWPWVADLARLERARTVAFFAADPEPWNLAALRALTPEALEALRFAKGRVATLLRLDWRADQVVAGKPGAPDPEPCALLVCRQGYTPSVEKISALQAAALEAAWAGKSLGELCGLLAELDTAGEAAALFSWFSSWGATGALEKAR